MTIDKAIGIIKDNIAYQRRMLTVLSSRKTQTILHKIETKPELLAEFWEIFEAGSVAKLKYWLSHFVELELTEMTSIQLRDIAKSYRIPLYYRLTNDELIQEITHARQNPTTSQTNEATDS